MKSPLLDLTKPLVDRLARPVRYVATDAFLPKPIIVVYDKSYIGNVGEDGRVLFGDRPNPNDVFNAEGLIDWNLPVRTVVGQHPVRLLELLEGDTGLVWVEIFSSGNYCIFVCDRWGRDPDSGIVRVENFKIAVVPSSPDAVASERAARFYYAHEILRPTHPKLAAALREDAIQAALRDGANLCGG